ncbi:hypothetical protein L1049_028167 [Liquidambar formosana]|uniref:Peptidase A1 domain-containing protein n=1 Tax=Liquidambar formosana TaxID=63359 RepID=A0AAP0RJ76_LIQFO
MADKPFFSSLTFSFLFCCCCFYSPSVLCRSLSETPHTTVLDVSASVQKTLDVLSFNPLETQTPLHEEELATSLSSSSSFSLQLQPRDSLHNSQYEDYKSLLLSRLERDSARVDSLTTRLSLALNGIKKSDLKPMDTEVQPEDISTPVISGTSQGSGEYFSRIGIGSPAKPFYMALDTGSDVNWIQCQPCTDCYEQSDPIFDPSSSSSYSKLTCSSTPCRSLDVSGCRNGTCMYQVSYGDGSYTMGEFVTETVSFGSSGSVPKVAIGCGHDNEGLFVASAGLLGLGGGALSLNSQIKAKSFSYCLVDRDSSSSSTLEFNSALPGNSVTAPLRRNSKIDTFFYVGLTGLSVGGQMLSIPQSLFEIDTSGNGGIIIDSGTAITRLRSEVYDSLRNSFVQKTQDLPSTSGVALFDTCYDLSSMSSVRVPTVSFHFGSGKSVPLPAKNYLIPVDSAGTYCFAFAPTSSSLSIIGNVQQQGIRVNFDLANSVVGFSPSNC